MKKDIIPAFMAITLCAGGMLGLYHHVEHTGWLLFAGIVISLFHSWGKCE